MKFSDLPYYIFALLVAGHLPATAETLLSDNFSSSTVSTTTDGFRLRHSSIGNGWQAAKQGGGSAWIVENGTLTNSGILNSATYPDYISGEGPVAQAINLTSIGIPDEDFRLKLSFDYNIAAGDSLRVFFWGHTGTFDESSAELLANLEGKATLSNAELQSTLDAFNLGNGTTDSFQPFITLQGGSSGTFTRTLNLKTLGITGVLKVNDLSVLTLGFAKIEDGLAGSTSISDLNISSLPQPISSTTVVLSDDFTSSSVSTTTDGFRLRENGLNNGWQAARQGGGSAWTVFEGTLQNASIVNTPGYPNYIPAEAPVAQSVELSSLGVFDIETLLTLSFDYDVAPGDLLNVNLWGHAGSYDPSTNSAYANLEVRGGLGNTEGTSTLDAFNLLNGATTGFGGLANPLVSLSGTGSYSTTIDLPSLGIAVVDKITDLSVLTLAFAKIEDGLAGTTSISGLSLTSSSPPGSGILEITDISYHEGSGNVILSFTGAPSTTYQLNTSQDLITFTPMPGTTALTDSSGQSTFSVPYADFPSGHAFFQISTTP